jgi:Cdc6-like AAA superfamily ATPase
MALPDLDRSQLIRNRWLRCGLVVLLSSAFWLLLAVWQQALLGKLAKMSAGAWIIAALAAVAILAWQGRRGWQAMLALYDLRHFAARPPYWIAVAAGAALALLLASHLEVIATVYRLSTATQHSARSWSYALLGIVAALGALGWMAPWNRRTAARTAGQVTRQAVPARRSGLQAASMAELLAWIKSDDPVDHEDADLLDYHSIARRMADRLTALPASVRDDRSQALLGRQGSGKTTILHLVRRELARRGHNDLEVLEVQLWGYETARAAVVGILDQLVDALGRQVNVVALRSLSGAYAEGISKLRSGSTLAMLGARARSPAHLLDHLDQVARVIAVRYVIWIEDLERFAGNDVSDDKLGVVRALLHGLHRLPSFTVITATSELSQSFDPDKIAGYVEHVPPLPLQVARSLCARFLQHWRTQAAQAALVVVDEPASWPAPGDVGIAPGWDGNRPFDIPSSVVQLLPTPRVLKRVLRRCEEAWSLLAGEVNLDEMLAMTAVRESSPRAYARFEEHLDRLRAGPWEHDRNRHPASALDDLEKALRADLAGESAMVLAAVVTLARLVFDSDTNRTLQGLRTRLPHADYWQRFSALQSLLPEQRDQYVLAALTTGTPDQILDVLREPYGGAAAHHLARCVNWPRFLELLIPCVRRDMQYPEPAFNPLWRILLSAAEIPQRSTESLIAKVDEAIAVCVQAYGLRTLADLESWIISVWHKLEASSIHPIAEPEAIALQQRVRAGLVRHVGEPQRLTAALRGMSGRLLLKLVGGPDTRTWLPMPDRTPFPGWTQFAAVVLDALELDPEVMAPQVAFLISLSIDNTWHYQPSFCAVLFGDSHRVLVAMARCSNRDGAMAAIHAASSDLQTGRAATVDASAFPAHALDERLSSVVDAAEPAG